MKTRRNKTNKIIVTLLVVLLLVTSIPVSALAGTITKGNQTLSINNGQAVLTVDGNNYQLTKSLVTKDGVIDDVGTTYLQWMNGSLYFYSYKYQAKDVKLTFLASGVTALTNSGYETANGHFSFLTETEVKAKLGVNDNNSNNSGNNNNGSTNNVGAYMVGTDTVLYNDGTNTYVLSSGQTVSEIAESNGIVYIRYSNGEIKSWATSNKTNIKLETMAVNTKAIYKVNGIVTGYYDANGNIASFTNSSNATVTQYLSVQNGQVTLLIWQNNSIIKTYTLSDKNSKWAAFDANNTCYVKKENGNLYIWNYDLQKTDSSVKLIKIASNVKDAVISNNKLIGYTIDGSNAMQPVWTLEQVKVAIAIAKAADTSNSTTDNTNNTNNDYKLSHKTGTTWYYLKDSKGNVIDKYKFRKGVVTYHGWKFYAKKVYYNANGNLIMRNKKVTRSIDRATMQLKTISMYTKSIKIENGFAKALVKTNGVTINLAKY